MMSRPGQPGGRAPAPAQLAPVQAFINTHFDLGADYGAEVLGTPAALGRWLADCGLLDSVPVADDDDLRRALDVRETLRALARRNGAAPGVPLPPALARLNAAAAGACLEIRFAAGGPRFVAGAGAGVPGAIGILLAITAAAMIDGSWARLKVCSGRHCGWAFYDHSRNRAGRWCSMSVCGGRAKARAHYQRRHTPSGGAP
jgi:predicted RNA-binding Zn ribbon-like protein